MKFQKFESFEKHFKEAYPHNLSSIYAIVCPRENERKKILASLMQILEKECDVRRCQQIHDALEHLSGASLFSKKVAAQLDCVEALLQAEFDLLAQYVVSPNPQGYLVLGAENAKSISELYKRGKKEMVVLDLCQEKPWEEKQRIQTWVMQVVRAQKKRLTPDAVDLLFKMLPLDRLLLQQELDKLICYTAGREEITRTDVEEICNCSTDLNLFQFAQELIWGKPQVIPEMRDLATILPLIGLLRSQLEMGLKMATLLKKGMRQEEITAAFPRLWPKALQQCLNKVQQSGFAFFKQGLTALFELEFGLKTSRAKPGVLFTVYLSQVLQTH